MSAVIGKGSPSVTDKIQRVFLRKPLPLNPHYDHYPPLSISRYSKTGSRRLVGVGSDRKSLEPRLRISATATWAESQYHKKLVQIE